MSSRREVAASSLRMRFVRGLGLSRAEPVGEVGEVIWTEVMVGGMVVTVLR